MIPGVAVVGSVLGAVAITAVVAGVDAANDHQSTGSWRWVDILPSMDDTADDEDEESVLEATAGVLQGTLVAWLGLAVLTRYGCHAVSQLAVAPGVAASRRPLGTGRLVVALGYSQLTSSRRADVLARSLTTAAGVVVLSLSFPPNPTSMPLLAAFVGLQAGFLLLDLPLGVLTWVAAG